MLNPEAVDNMGNDKMKILFTDSDADETVIVILSNNDIWSLKQMIEKQFNPPCKKCGIPLIMSATGVYCRKCDVR